MSCGRLFHNFGAANIKSQLPRVFDDFSGGKWSKVPSHKYEKKDDEEPCYLKS